MLNLNPNEQTLSVEPTVPELVNYQATLRPHAVAVAAGEEVLTYEELNEKASELANHLRAIGVRPDVTVGLCIKSSLAMVVGALGILKSGGAYLPLDPAYPSERLSFIMKDAQIPVLVTAQCLACSLPKGDWRVVGVDPQGRFAEPQSPHTPAQDASAENLAYVIYTSGSTGQPKGVQVTHRNLMNLVRWHQREFAVTAKDRATQLAGVGFDAAVWELWPYLTAGASVLLADEAVRTEPEALRDWLLSRAITISFVPTLLCERIMLLDWPSTTPLRYVLTGADTLHHYPSEKLPFALVNNYGPTECTVVASSGLIPPSQRANQRPAIGKPIDNVKIYILDEKLRKVPASTPGELYIGGAGVARGYLNRPDLTAERFVPDPFSEEPGARMYKTGDWACYLPDGQVSFLGRIDDQIKIRGFRIEPNEVVSALNQHPSVLESAVVAREIAAGDKRLVAYFVPAPDSQPGYSELRDFLGSRLPEYMVPATLVRLAALPLNSNGKVDRGALPEPTDANSLRDEGPTLPRTPVEKRLSEILSALLNVEQVGVNDNFFMLGGHSLLGTQLIARVREAFGTEISLRFLFDHPKVASIATEVERLILVKLEAMSEEEVQRVLSGGASFAA